MVKAIALAAAGIVIAANSGAAQSTAGSVASPGRHHAALERAAVMAAVGRYLRTQYSTGLAVDGDLKCVNRTACHAEHVRNTRPAARVRRRLSSDSLVAALRRTGAVRIATLADAVPCVGPGRRCRMAPGVTAYVQAREPSFRRDTALVVLRVFTTEPDGVRPRESRLALTGGRDGQAWKVVRVTPRGWR